MEWILLVVTIAGMIVACYFTSGIAVTPGSIFEKKTESSKKAR